MDEEIEYTDIEFIPTCRICDQEGTFELSKNKFRVDETDVLLMTAFNCFSNIENVGFVPIMHIPIK